MVYILKNDAKVISFIVDFFTNSLLHTIFLLVLQIPEVNTTGQMIPFQTLFRCNCIYDKVTENCNEKITFTFLAKMSNYRTKWVWTANNRTHYVLCGVGVVDVNQMHLANSPEACRSDAPPGGASMNLACFPPRPPHEVYFYSDYGVAK